MEGSWRDKPALESNGAAFESGSISQPPPYSLRNRDMSRAKNAIEEGRRIYVGNLPYEALTGDVEKLFPSGEYTM
jgi:RNA recognition motif-containing protein